MVTKFSEIYELFLPQIDDYSMSALDPEEIEIYIEKYLIIGLLTVNSSIYNTLNIDTSKKEFETELPLFVKIMLSKAMKLEWLKEKKFSEELMRKSLGDRDYKAVQGTDYLKQITAVEKELKAEIKRDLISYSYADKSMYGGLIWKVISKLIRIK